MEYVLFSLKKYITETFSVSYKLIPANGSQKIFLNLKLPLILNSINSHSQFTRHLIEWFLPNLKK